MNSQTSKEELTKYEFFGREPNNFPSVIPGCSEPHNKKGACWMPSISSEYFVPAQRCFGLCGNIKSSPRAARPLREVPPSPRSTEKQQ